MKYALLLLLMTLCAAADAQQRNNPWANEHFSRQHQQEKQREQLAIALRVKQLQGASNERNEVQYAENRRRCQVALRVAEACGKHAGMFYCDAKGFRPVAAGAAAIPVVMNNVARYRMERCALDTGKQKP